MSQPGYGAPSDAGERWNVNMPAVIGVVFVFLIGVIVWVIASGGDGDGAAGDPGAASTTTGTPGAETGVTEATSEAPMPGVSTATTTPEPIAATTTTEPPPTTTTEPPPVTTAAGADEGAIPGDLAIPGRPMRSPTCDGGYITVLASAVGDQATADGIGNVLDDYPGANYLRTDQTCSSLTPAIDGAPIYVVYLGPFAFDSDACEARSEGPEGAYARRLSNDLGPDHSVVCP